MQECRYSQVRIVFMQKKIQERKDGMWRDLEWDATVNLGGAASVCELPATAAVKFPTSSIITIEPR